MSKINQAILSTFVSGDADDAALASVKTLAARMAQERFASLAQTLASEHYSVPLITKSTGKVVFDSSAPKYETARKRVQRLIAFVYPKDSGEEVEIPAHIAKLAEALAKACAKHDEKGKKGLGSAALAKAW
jgi:hypothetical protein